MERYYALIKKGLVIHIVVADDSFLRHVSEYTVVDVTGGDRPHVGDSYLPDTSTFLSNNKETIELPYDEDSRADEGTEEGFEPFNISKYRVSYEAGYVFIGCKKYSALGLMDALRKTLVEKKENAACFSASDIGPTDGTFHITWEDAKRLYEALGRVKL